MTDPVMVSRQQKMLRLIVAQALRVAINPQILIATDSIISELVR